MKHGDKIIVVNPELEFLFGRRGEVVKLLPSHHVLVMIYGNHGIAEFKMRVDSVAIIKTDGAKTTHFYLQNNEQKEKELILEIEKNNEKINLIEYYINEEEKAISNLAEEIIHLKGELIELKEKQAELYEELEHDKND